MRQPPSRPGQHIRYSVLSLALLILGGCGAAPEKQPEQVAQAPQQHVATQQGISLALPPSDFSNEFSAAEQSLQNFDWMSASVILDPLAEQPLNRDDSSYLSYLQARIAYTRGLQPQALLGLESLEYPGTNAALQYRARDLRRRALALSGDHLESARLGDLMLRNAPSEKTDMLRREIWHNLQQLDQQQLQQAMDATTDLRWHGWLELAAISRTSGPGNTLELTAWRSNNAQHPAADTLPGGLAYLLEANPAQVQKVALLLPLSERLAPAGKAVLDGYLASYYASYSRPELAILDLDQYPSATAAYNAAMAQGANLVVGPLSKEAVGELGKLPQRPVPVLALNRAGQTGDTGSGSLVQLSLAPEDEAALIAEHAFGQGARSALIIRPAGSWGNKMESVLRQRWAALGGTVTGSESYTGREDYSPSVKNGLDIFNSERRARSIRDMLATNIESTGRRRQDIDTIFLLSRSAADARSIKPLLSFHYAGDLPVYATSSIYSGIPDPRDKDLNGINLVEIPWLLGTSPGLRVAIAAGGTGSDNYTRLNALGTDAHLLQSRFMQLQAGPDALLRGNTGLLTLDQKQRIHRELSLATFDGGKLRPQ